MIMEAEKYYVNCHLQAGSPGKLVMRFQSKPEVPRVRGASGVSPILSPSSTDVRGPENRDVPAQVGRTIHPSSVFLFYSSPQGIG